MSKSKAKVIKAVRELETARASGSVHRAGESWNVEQWLTHWLENLAAPFVKVNTLAGYRVAVNHHLIPGLGKHKLTALKPEHLERLYLRISRPAPRAEPSPNQQPHTTSTERRIFQTALRTRNGARWAIALALGLRQGEALGLQWSDLDFDTQTITIRRARLRPKYEHGCHGQCGKKYPGYCPQRVPIRDETDTPKSRAGRREVGLPDALCILLREHREKQNEERQRAGQLWQDGDWLFATETGASINPRTDWSGWKRLLTDAGVRDGRLHDARHTAATVLLLLGVSERAIMGVMGWSNPAMAHRYAHMVEPIRKDVADRVGGRRWATQKDDATNK
jgi:integrase